jgi:hypothetical protein
MNKAITVLLIVGALWGVWQLREMYMEKKRENPEIYNFNEEEPDGPPKIEPRSLKGLHYSLETPLANAQARGADGMKRFLNQYRSAIRDPRLAWIELDYVVLVGIKDPAEARAVFAQVKNRTPTNSPVYPRIQTLSKTYD